MIKLASLFSGSSGNCIFISDGETRFLVDAGLSGKTIEAAMETVGEKLADLNGILITHEHGDHTKGAGILSRRYKIPIYANTGTWSSIGTQLGKIAPDLRRVFVTGESFFVGNVEISPFPIPHDAKEPVGYNFFVNKRKITVATDIGHMNNALLARLANSDMILLESNHDIEMLKVGPYPWPLKQRILSEHGHLCNDMAGKVVAYLAENGTKCFLLGHLSHENNFPELALQTTCNALNEKNIKPGMDVFVEVAHRDRVSRILFMDEPSGTAYYMNEETQEYCVLVGSEAGMV